MKKLAIIISSLLAINAYADTQQQTLKNLQTQLNTLQKKVVKLEDKSAGASGNVDQTHGSKSMVGVDSSNPYGAMSKTRFAYSVLKTKNSLDNPLVLGGQLQADLQAWNGTYSNFTTNKYYQSGSTVNLSHAYLFTTANVGEYVTGVVMLKNNVPASTNNPQNNTATPVIDRAFITFGNLSASPFYLTVGQEYLSYGPFNGDGPLNNALTTNAFRVAPTNQATLGWSEDGFNANLGVYENAAYGNGSNPVIQQQTSRIQNFLANIEYHNAINDMLNYTIGAGYINDITHTASGLGTAIGSPQGLPNSNKDGAVDTNLVVNYDQFGVLGEYDTTTASAITNGNTYSKASAWMTGVTYKSAMMDIPTKMLVSYSATINMQNVALVLPGDYPTAATTNGYKQSTNNLGMRSQWLASVTGEVYKNVYVGPEFEWIKLYASPTNNYGPYTWAATLDGTVYM